ASTRPSRRGRSGWWIASPTSTRPSPWPGARRAWTRRAWSCTTGRRTTPRASTRARPPPPRPRRRPSPSSRGRSRAGARASCISGGRDRLAGGHLFRPPLGQLGRHDRLAAVGADAVGELGARPLADVALDLLPVVL